MKNLLNKAEREIQIREEQIEERATEIETMKVQVQKKEAQKEDDIQVKSKCLLCFHCVCGGGATDTHNAWCVCVLSLSLSLQSKTGLLRLRPSGRLRPSSS